MGRERGSGRESEVMACVSLALPQPLPLPLLVRARIKINADISHIFFFFWIQCAEGAWVAAGRGVPHASGQHFL